RRGDPVFSYRLTVEVTDATGESRGDEITVSAGYVGLEATLTVPSCSLEGTDVPLTVGLRSHGGGALAGQGTVTVYALRGPARPVASELADPWRRGGNEEEGAGDPSDWRNWPSGDKVVECPFTTGGEEKPTTVVPLRLPRGAYRAVLDSRDAAGQPVRAMRPFLVLREGADEPGLPVPLFVFALAKGSWEVGETFHALAATGYDRGPMRVEFFRDNRLLKAYWTEPGRPQTTIDFPVTAELRGGFTLVVTLVKENRLYQEVRSITVPWSDKELKLAWATFRDRQRPGQTETWQLKISGPRTGPLAAELVATLYDASLDQYLTHRFPGFAGLFARDRTWLSHAFANQPADWHFCFDHLNVEVETVTPQYPSYPNAVRDGGWWSLWAWGKFARRMKALPMAAPMAESDAGVAGGGMESSPAAEPEGSATDGEKPRSGPPATAIQDVRARTDLTETAFFFPQQVAAADGTVTLSFRMPEALTRWHFMAFAHTTDLQSGGLEAFTVTQKELMVQPNPPRFLREGDELEFPVKVSNLTDRPLSGSARLTFADPDGDRGLDVALGLAQTDLPFELPARGSTTLSWRLHVPDGLSLVSFKTVATAGEFSDGEGGLLPVLPRRIAVRGAWALWVNGPGEKRFTPANLQDPASAATRKDLSLTVEMTGNPAWTAIMALPTLMEYPHECAEQLCNRLYANALARAVAVSHPRVRTVFEQWR
ncbi:MAG TPA: alpha-2-macroglobulin family protein, partial [Candidatus Aminicenantes bacterium]|nr:alpha-2-macroglobulin family protein [Candidatus Aminicenantes bacterium]